MQLRGPSSERRIATDVVPPFEPDVGERTLDELLDRVTLARRDDVVVRLVLLQHEPHRPDVVARIAPVAAGVEVAEDELVAPARARSPRRRAPPCGAGSRAAAAATRGCRGSRSTRTARSGADSCCEMKCPYALATPYGVSGRERRRLGLRRLPRLAEDLARRRLVEPDRRIDLADRLEHRGHADRGELGRQHRLVPRARHERRRGEVEDLGGTRVTEHGASELWSRRSARTSRQPVRDSRKPIGVRLGRAPDDAEDLVSLLEQQLGEEGAVLAADPCYQRASLPAQERICP